MGVSGLLPCFRGSTKEVHVSKYANQVVAIDGYAWLHRGVHACAAELGAGGTSDKHIEFCMGRVALLLHYKVRPLLVFDGGALPAKAAQEATRRGRREHARAMAAQKARENAHEEARRWYAKCVDVTPAMAAALVDACVARWGRERVDFLVAPYEADAQLAQLARSGEAAAIVSEDSDNLAYGVPRVLFKLEADGRAQEVLLGELFAAPPGWNALDVRGWSQDMFVTMCALAGCDYVDAVKNVGIKKAHALVHRYRTRAKVLRALRYEHGASVPDDYERRVDRAALTFGHQVVFSRSSQSAVHLAPLPADARAAHGDWPDFLGAWLPDSVSRGIANADLDPETKLPLPRGKVKSTLVHRDLSRATEDLPQRNTLDAFVPKVPRQTKRPPPPPPRPRAAPEPDDDDVSSPEKDEPPREPCRSTKFFFEDPPPKPAPRSVFRPFAPPAKVRVPPSPDKENPPPKRKRAPPLNLRPFAFSAAPRSAPPSPVAEERTDAAAPPPPSSPARAPFSLARFRAPVAVDDDGDDDDDDDAPPSSPARAPFSLARFRYSVGSSPGVDTPDF